MCRKPHSDECHKLGSRYLVKLWWGSSSLKKLAVKSHQLVFTILPGDMVSIYRSFSLFGIIDPVLIEIVIGSKSQSTSLLKSVQRTEFHIL